MDKKFPYAITAALIFTGFLCLGMVATWENYITSTLWDVYFGADTGRAYSDMAFIESDHYRIKVHPLFLLLVQPVILLTNGITQNPDTSIILVQSAAATFVALCIFYVLNVILELKKRLSILLCCIYITSFSTILFTATAETFLHASLFLVLFWLWVIWKWKNDMDLSVKDMPFIIFFGITTFGITITNYMQYAIGLCLLIAYAPSIKKFKKVSLFFVINGLNLFIITLLAYWQQFCWKGNVPVFWESLINSVNDSNNFEEYQYMDFNFSIEKFFTECKYFFGHALIAGNITEDNHFLKFAGFSKLDTLALEMIFIIIFSLLIFYILKRNRFVRFSFVNEMFRKDSKNNPLLVVLFISLCYNLCLHYVYGYGECFIYSQHYLFLIIFIFGILLSELKNEKICTWVSFVLYFYTGYAFFRNMYDYGELVSIIREYCRSRNYSLKYNIFKTGLIFFNTIFASLIFAAVSIKIKKAMSSIINVKITNKRRFILSIMLLYGLYSFIVSFFILINYYRGI